MKDFQKFALDRRISSSTLGRYTSIYDGYINPTILEERKMNVTQMDVFSRLMQDRIIFLGTEIDSDVANIITAQLLWLNSTSDEEITLMINSPGGVCYDGLAILDTMNTISSPVATQCVGMAASMGAVLLSAGEKGRRLALPHSRVMIHQPLGGARGQASDIQIEAEQILILKKELCGILAENSGQPLDKVIADCDRDHWMIAQEAKEYGLIDEIIKKKDETDLQKEA
jgi:ATP-dependent Clp protease protease subunit